MSAHFTKESVIQNKKSAIKAMNNLLERYINDPSDEHLKKANLISYWLKDYCKMISFEESFKPTKNCSYSRGNIVKLNFGFNVGAEYGGLHYGIVLDNQNAHHSPVVTLIPLTSTKEGKELHKNNVDLGNDIYKLLKNKYNRLSNDLNEENKIIDQMLSSIRSTLDLVHTILDETKKIDPDSVEYDRNLAKANLKLDSVNILRQEWEEKKRSNADQQDCLNRIDHEISKMKEGSVALVSQITTVSKIRIFDPKNAKGILSNVSLSKENMEKINQKVKELYVFQ